ncbi:SDR family oxidoreductase [Vibrio owensii]|uniref:SDR family oxidoreductase n=1 Tax=Vibrio owensii TaxID=696485 RepID=UPI0009988381|nr:SDR family oxidoreductase [Vibrio owensii]AQW59442.1 NAD(P)-dependent oxidoreductase [Vibrio owensii]
MDILVLGATGNTGSEVVRQLQQTGADFGVMVRSANSTATMNLQPEQVREGDFTDVAAMEKAMQGVKRIYVSMPIHQDNKLWVKNVIAAAKAANVEHVVKLSGMGAKSDADSEIIRTHVVTDDLVKASGLAWTIIQPNSFFQNLFGSLATINAMGKFFLPLGDAKQSVVDIRDVAAVIVESLIGEGHDGQTYLLSGPEALTFAQQAEVISQASGKQIEYVAVSEQDAAAAMKEAGMDEWFANALAEIMAWFGTGAYTEVTDTVERVTGKPARNFDDFANEFAHAIEK